MMYPGTDISPTVLSNDKTYRSTTFVKISRKEYLAVCDEDGCLYLWDIESKTSKKVFDMKLPSEQRSGNMNIFKIDDNTIGYGESRASSDGSRRVFILKTEKEGLTLSSTLRLFTPNDIWDMCYMEVKEVLHVFCCVFHIHALSWRWRWSVVKLDGKPGWNRWERNLNLGASAQIRTTVPMLLTLIRTRFIYLRLQMAQC